MNELSFLLKIKKQSFSQKKRYDVSQIIRNFTIYKNVGLYLFKSHVRNIDKICGHCCQYGHENNGFA